MASGFERMDWTRELFCQKKEWKVKRLSTVNRIDCLNDYVSSKHPLCLALQWESPRAVC